ncbi:MAG TPA: hypothetical protein PK702_13290, partial [Burkholderiaceae bacterium]|nr:hypothetical protein [Burkholderiaceae bacterium]
MFDDSLAPTHEPKAIFREGLNSELVAPVHKGYLAQVKADVLNELSALIKTSNRIDVRVAVSRIEKIATLTAADVLGSRESKFLWQAAIQSEQGRVFTACLAPYFDVASRESVVRSLLSLQSQGVISPLNNLVSISRETGSDADQLQLQDGSSANSISQAAREYRQNPFARLQITLRDHASLQTLIASGTVFRIDPVRPLVAAEVPTAPDPERPMPDEQWQPIVGVIDGGLFARSYEPMVAWRAPSLVADVVANRAHGNQVGSLVVHGASWNTHLNLPQLTCRIGIAQAIAQNGHGSATRPEFQSYLRSVVARHCGDTKVWNFSFNEPVDGADRMEMSELGHEIHRIAREFNILPVIAIGNSDQTNNQRLCPPSDCEAALTVSG